MEWYRLVGALLLGVSGVSGAYWLNRSSSAVLAQMEQWQTLLRYVKLQVDCFSLPASTILSRCDPALLRACGYERPGAPKSFEELLSGCYIRDAKAGEILRGFAAEFGKSYREEQLRGCEYYLTLLGQRRDAVAAQLPGKKKLNATLCVSGALAVVILLM